MTFAIIYLLIGVVLASLRVSIVEDEPLLGFILFPMTILIWGPGILIAIAEKEILTIRETK